AAGMFDILPLESGSLTDIAAIMRRYEMPASSSPTPPWPTSPNERTSAPSSRSTAEISPSSASSETARSGSSPISNELPGDLLPFLVRLTDPEDVAIGVAQVHLPDTPRLVGRRHGDLESLLQAIPVDRIDVVDPDRHPDAFVRPIGLTRRGQVALAA